jgi:hypothetical protein
MDSNVEIQKQKFEGPSLRACSMQPGISQDEVDSFISQFEVATQKKWRRKTYKQQEHPRSTNLEVST